MISIFLKIDLYLSSPLLTYLQYHNKVPPLYQVYEFYFEFVEYNSLKLVQISTSPYWEFFYHSFIKITSPY